MLTSALDLLLPSACVGCGVADGSLCARCGAALLRPRRHRPRPSPADLPRVWAAGSYDGALRAAVIAYKERSRRDLAATLGRALARTIASAVAGTDPPVGPMWVVPVPSQPRAARARGGDHMVRLARVAARDLNATGWHARVMALLHVVGRPRDSSGLSATERARNLCGAFALRPAPARRPPPSVVVVVDDVVTTGATLAEVGRVLARAGLTPAAAAVVAATARRDAAVSRQLAS